MKYLRLNGFEPRTYWSNDRSTHDWEAHIWKHYIQNGIHYPTCGTTNGSKNMYLTKYGAEIPRFFWN